MRARDSIDVLFESIEGLGSRKVGIELEILVLSKFKRQFQQLARSLDIGVGSDFSMEKRHEGFEQFYGTVEIDIGRRPWTEIEGRLTQLTSWLRHEVPIKFKSQARPRVPAREHEIHLPIGRVSQTMTGALHIHFDIDDWFRDHDHFRSFLAVFNEFLDRGDLESMVAKSRYAVAPKKSKFDTSSPYGQGHEYAKPWPAPVPRPTDVKRFQNLPSDELTTMSAGSKTVRRKLTFDTSRVRDFVRWWAKEMDVDRLQAVNLLSSWDHGTLEFRFPNATLSISAISGWVEFLAGLINFSRDKNYGQFLWASRRGEHKTIGQFMDKRKAAHGHPQFPPPWDRYDYEVPRSYRKLGLESLQPLSM